jgi:hypothetical protein
MVIAAHVDRQVEIAVHATGQSSGQQETNNMRSSDRVTFFFFINMHGEEELWKPEPFSMLLPRGPVIIDVSARHDMHRPHPA